MYHRRRLGVWRSGQRCIVLSYLVCFEPSLPLSNLHLQNLSFDFSVLGRLWSWLEIDVYYNKLQ